MTDGPVARVEAVAEVLREAAGAAADAGGYFPALYSRVTDRVAASVREGRFDHGERMSGFVAAFAAYYTRALQRQGQRPRCWQATWDVARDDRLLVVQHLLLGINAHVNHDLAQAVVAVADTTGDLASVKPGFDAVNLILAETYVDVLRDLDRVSRWANEVAALGGGRAFNFSLRVARDQAWTAAERLFPLGEDGRRAYVRQLDEFVSVLAYLITQPPLVARPVVWLARRLEEHDPEVVTAALLGR